MRLNSSNKNHKLFTLVQKKSQPCRTVRGKYHTRAINNLSFKIVSNFTMNWKGTIRRSILVGIWSASRPINVRGNLNVCIVLPSSFDFVYWHTKGLSLAQRSKTREWGLRIICIRLVRHRKSSHSLRQEGLTGCFRESMPQPKLLWNFGGRKLKDRENHHLYNIVVNKSVERLPWLQRSIKNHKTWNHHHHHRS